MTRNCAPRRGLQKYVIAFCIAIDLTLIYSHFVPLERYDLRLTISQPGTHLPLSVLTLGVGLLVKQAATSW